MHLEKSLNPGLKESARYPEISFQISVQMQKMFGINSILKYYTSDMLLLWGFPSKAQNSRRKSQRIHINYIKRILKINYNQ